MNHCSAEGCDKPSLARGLCKNHYEAARRAGKIPQRVEKLCSVEGCARRSAAKGYCDWHYRMTLRNGAPFNVRGNLDLRFQRNITKPDGDDGCWVWTGDKWGLYGRFNIGSGRGRAHSAHRWAYERFVGPIPEGMTIDHLCRNTLCVNPLHLEPVTLQVNILRGENVCAKYARRTHCNRGHLLEPPNIRLDGNARRCVLCDKIRREQKKAG